MAGTEQILQALKHVMRGRGVTYKQAAEALDLSEVSVKRLFSERSFSLQRLETLCELAQTDLGELLQLAEAAEQQIHQLSVEQEQALVADTGLLLVAVCVMNHMRFDEILKKYEFDEPALIRLFARLDRMGILELLPGNRYRLRLSRRFALQPNGPVQSFFINNMLKEFLSPQAKAEHAPFQLAWAMLSKESAAELRRKIQRLIEEYLQMAEYDTRIPAEDKLTSSLFVMFHEDMEPSLFRERWKVRDSQTSKC
jgi:hypothetical protein